MTCILLVDDSASVLRLLTFLFESERYDVMTASDGAEGLQRIAERMPDVVITDSVMPGMSGSELVRKLKAQPSTRHIPVIMLTSSEAEPGDVPVDAAQLAAVLQKSADFTPLLNKVAEILRR